MLPLFTSHYSIGSSVLTLDSPNDPDHPIPENSPQSVFQICLKNKLDKLILIESNLSGFVKALKNSQECKLDLLFGLKLSVCADLTVRNTDSLSSEYKVIIFAKDDEGYRLLRTMYSTAATKGFYYRPRIDCSTIKQYWNNKHLLLAHPFYNSFLHRNTMFLANCTPSFEFVDKQYFFIEKNGLPFNFLIEEAIEKYQKINNIETALTKTIYYENKEDFKIYIVNKAIHNRTTLNVPNEDHLASNEFCFEDWKGEKNE